MKRELLLLRHGKSNWNIPSSDFERPLKKRGRNGAKIIGAYLANKALLPDYIISSPAARAQQTAEIACAQMKIPVAAIHYNDRLYKTSFTDLVRIIQNCPKSAKRILVIGHNPSLESFAFYLPNEEVLMPEDGKLLPTTSLAIFEHEELWSSLQIGAKGKLSIIRPKTLSSHAS